MNSTFFLVLRRMRIPLIVLIVIYAISVFGLTLIPGVDAEGKTTPPLSFFHAFYFVSYTATTIGFGEIPVAFSDGQRLWVTLCIYLTVIGWSYSVVTLIALLQDKGFQNTLTLNRFRRRVQRLRQPFYLVCGCGETGSLICQTFDHIQHAFVVLEKDEIRVQELDLQDFKTDTPALAADASQPENLLCAGLKHPKCRGVLAVTDDEESNLAIAMAVRLLNPKIPVIARARTAATVANMASFGTNHIINPFSRFADHLAMAIAAPERFRLVELLTSLPETTIPSPHRPPAGQWILCGYGSFGQAVAEKLLATGIELTIIEPSTVEPIHPHNYLGAQKHIVGKGTEAPDLLAAGVKTAAGLIAGSNNDVNNLSIAMTAYALNRQLFVVLRQNQHRNAPLFNAYAAEFTMVSSKIVAQESIAILTTPLLAKFLDLVRLQDEIWCAQQTERLSQLNDGLTPVVWGQKLNISESPALYKMLMQGQTIRLLDLLKDGRDREQALPLIVLLIAHDNDEVTLLPEQEQRLRPGDHLLLAGPLWSKHNFDFTVDNLRELEYVLTGNDDSGSWLWAWWKCKQRLGRSN